MKFKIGVAVFGALLLVLGATWGASALSKNASASASKAAAQTAKKPTASASSSAPAPGKPTKTPKPPKPTSTATSPGGYTGTVATTCDVEARATTYQGKKGVAYRYATTITGSNSVPPTGKFRFYVSKSKYDVKRYSTQPSGAGFVATKNGAHWITLNYFPVQNSAYRFCTKTVKVVVR